jgi:hypothetical protein
MKRTTTYKPQSRQRQLADYPEAIAEVRAAIARLDQRLFDLKGNVKRREDQFDIWVGESTELKNDSQRRAAIKRHKHADVEYLGWVSLTQNLEEQRTQHEIKLELLRNAFTVAKLQARQAIADQISGIDGISLVA